MKIHLKQAEIITALTQYIANQGINLTSKQVSIDFTAGRKEGGLTADIDITDTGVVIPGYTDTPADEVKEAAKVTLGVIDGGLTEAKPQRSVEEIAKAAMETPLPEDEVETKAKEAPVENKPSLFS